MPKGYIDPETADRIAYSSAHPNVHGSSAEAEQRHAPESPLRVVQEYPRPSGTVADMVRAAMDPGQPEGAIHSTPPALNVFEGGEHTTPPIERDPGTLRPLPPTGRPH